MFRILSFVFCFLFVTFNNRGSCNPSNIKVRTNTRDWRSNIKVRTNTREWRKNKIQNESARLAVKHKSERIRATGGQT